MMNMRFRFVRTITTALVGLLMAVVTIGFANRAGAFAASDSDTPEFGYTGDSGPGFWGESAGWEACAGATTRNARQSPIDIDRVVLDPRLGPLRLQLHDTPVALTNN